MQSRPTARSVTFTFVPTTRNITIRHSIAAFGVILVLGAGVAGCGGGDDESDAPAPTATTGVTEAVAITTDELISEGDAICGEVNTAIGSIDASTADETTKSDQRADLYEGIADGLSELGTPSDGEPPTDVIAAAEDLANGSTDVTAFQTAAVDYGFTECTEAPAIPSVSTDPGTDSTGTEPSETYVPPATEVPAEPAPVEPSTSSGGGVAPTPTPVPTPTPAPSTGGSSSGGIGPG